MTSTCERCGGSTLRMSVWQGNHRYWPDCIAYLKSRTAAVARHCGQIAQCWRGEAIGPFQSCGCGKGIADTIARVIPEASQDATTGTANAPEGASGKKP